MNEKNEIAILCFSNQIFPFAIPTRADGNELSAYEIATHCIVNNY